MNLVELRHFAFVAWDYLGWNVVADQPAPAIVVNEIVFLSGVSGNVGKVKLSQEQFERGKGRGHH